ncbi:MAG TPA: TetR-like C-terminal domain-containing protein [Bacillota bacterium]|nr:TetR-like C-terminal domain-containing protein [Bacillota bacterium]HOK68350.1 TetR-like C-terminal domain-containing protein [Bacillota bacterium]HPP85260.1 TetR-like C-terminal domain-containing protein [Bacillota bacterium]
MSDRRVKYTKMVIKESFIKSLRQKPISKITVKEICEDADVNRATFYTHYKDQYDLLQQIENEIIEDINRYLKDYDIQDAKVVPLDMIEKITEYVSKNADVFDLLLNLNGDIKFQQEVIKIIGNQFIPIIENEKLNKADAEYIYHFIACGAVGIIQKWMKDGMKKSAREMAEIIFKMSNNGRASFE